MISSQPKKNYQLRSKMTITNLMKKLDKEVSKSKPKKTYKFKSKLENFEDVGKKVVELLSNTN